MPSLGGGSFSSDASDIGWQSAFQAGFGGVQIPMAGGDLCGYLGLMNSSMILYPGQIMLDAEIAMNVYETYKAFETALQRLMAIPQSVIDNSKFHRHT